MTRFTPATAVSITALLAAWSSTAEVGASDATTTMCYDSHEAGQLKRKRGEWRKARASFAACGDNRCPAIVQRDCVAWAAELAAQQPTVVVAVVRDDGTDVLQAKVTLDGSPIAVDGRAIEVDPGEHRVRVEARGQPPFEERFAVREGDRARRLRVTMPGPDAGTSWAPPPITYVFGGISVLAIGSFATFAAVGKAHEDELAGTCVNRCTDDEVAGVRRSYVVADVSLGVAVVAAGAAAVTWFLATRSRRSSKQTAALHLSF